VPERLSGRFEIVRMEALFMDDRLRKSVRTLTTWLGQMIREAEGEAFFERVERVRLFCKDLREAPSPDKERAFQDLLKGLDTADAHRLARAFTLYFQLVNLAEESQRLRRLRDTEREGAAPASMSLPRLVGELKAAGVPPERLTDALARLRIEPVLTAHPTEAKRRTILQHILRLARVWEAHDRPDLTAREAERTRDTFLETLEILWQTKQVRDRKLTVDDEISNVLYFFRSAILSATADFHDVLEDALKAHYPGLAAARRTLTFGSWVGGDRDGNPNVTPATSANALRRHRDLILAHYEETLEGLIGHLSFTTDFAPVEKTLQASLNRDLRRLPEIQERLRTAEPGEAYRSKLICMKQRLMNIKTGRPYAYAAAGEFLADLRLIEHSLGRHGGHRAAAGRLQTLILQAEVFGFHLARLDFRHHAGKTRAALQEVLRGETVADWPALIRGKPQWPRRLSDGARLVLEEVRTLVHLQKEFGAGSADHLILSMTRDAADLWGIVYLARLAGLVAPERGSGRPVPQTGTALPLGMVPGSRQGAPSGGRWVSRVDVVPLFETVEDLKNAVPVMRALWADPFYREILASRGNTQEIMLGYSDSNKHGGYLSANFNLVQAERGLSREAAAHGVHVRFFHGKGGTIDRGGGPAHRAILAAPESVTGYQLRITEQGEVISLKYGHPLIARRNFEQMASAVLMANLLSPKQEIPAADRARYEEAMAELAEASLARYRRLVYETPDFITYFMQATPIDVIERFEIASRPVFRGGVKSLSDMRAIPWVFSWTQARHLLSAWYGVGHGLEDFVKRHGAAGEKILKEMYARWPFFSSVIDNAQVSLAKADMAMAKRYAGLVEDAKIRETIFKDIEGEYWRSVTRVLSVSGQHKLLERSPVLMESILLRNPYVDSLHTLQLKYLPLWRSGRLSRKARQEALLVLLMTVNGIAFGMKSTG